MSSFVKRFRNTDYLVFSDGSVWSEKRDKKLKPSLTNGYLHVVLIHLGDRLTVNIHRMVAECFILNPNNLPQVNHIDGNKQNNRIENLEWCTQTENTIHAYKTGLAKGKKGRIGSLGIKNGNVKLTEEQVLEIRKLYETKQKTSKELRELFNVSKSTITYIVSRKSWNHI